ncbi:HEAT repeat domain-containing protein, partial [Candidatus Riflebacteria bacterium]
MKVEDLKKLLLSDDETNRKKGIAIMAKAPTKKNLSILMQIAGSDKSVGVRFFARKAINIVKARLKQKVGKDSKARVDVKKVEKYLNGTTREKLAVIQQIINKDLKDTLPLLSQRLSGEEDNDVLSALLLAVGKFGTDNEIEVLVPFLQHENSRIRADTIEALDDLGTPKIYPHIITLSEDPDNRVRANAALAVKDFSPATSLQILNEMLETEQPAMQSSAAYALQFFPFKRNVEILAGLLNSQDSIVKNNAINALTVYKSRGIQEAGDILEQFEEKTEL